MVGRTMDTRSKIWLPPRISTSWFVIRKNAEEHAESMFKHTNIKITTEDKRHLGAVIGTTKHRQNYMKEKIDQ